MNIQKAIGAGLLVFAIQFAMVSVIGNTVGPFLGRSAWAGYVWQAAMVALLVGIVYFVARWYFRGTATSYLQGLYLGLAIVVTGFVVNLLQTIPALAGGQSITEPLLQYVTSVSFWVTVAITLGSAMLAGYMGTKRHMGACNIKDAVGACMPETHPKEK